MILFTYVAKLQRFLICISRNDQRADHREMRKAERNILFRDATKVENTWKSSLHDLAIINKPCRKCHAKLISETFRPKHVFERK